MHLPSLRLENLVDPNRLQRLQDEFASRFGLSSLIVDETGTPLTRISNPNAVCLVLGGKNGPLGNLCDPSENLPGDLKRTTHYTCPITGLINTFVPVVLDGHPVGGWIILESKTEQEPGIADEALLAKYGLSAEDMQEAIADCPCHTRFGLNEATAYLEKLLRTILTRAAYQAAASTTAPTQGVLGSRIGHTMQVLNKFMHSQEIGMLLTDYHTGEILVVNGFYANWLDKPKEDILGKTLPELVRHDFDTYTSSCTAEKMLDADGNPAAPYQWNDFSASHNAWLRCTNQLVYWLDGRLAHLVTFHDITDERRTKDELSRLAYYDQHMNLPNALKLLVDLEHAHSEGLSKREFLVCFDIQSLRNLNDAHGRKAGDAFLRTVIKWINHQRFAARGTTIYRIEGDAFCLRLSGTDQPSAVSTAEYVFRRFTDLWSLVINGQQISILCGLSVSVVGVAALRKDDELLNIIERTLDISKKEKQVVVYDETVDRALQNHTQIQLSLKKCIKQRMNGFEVYFQPIVEPQSGRWQGLEALCRWTSPELGPLPPSVFIPEAEQMGLINPIGEWVLENAVRYCKTWNLDKVDGFFVSINLSSVQIMSSTLINTTLDILHRYDWPGNKLCLEVTESTKLSFENSHTLGFIDKLGSHGIMIALDDFGTGYSSFNNMKNLPVSLVKTDHSFIQGIEKDHFMQYFYHIITELAHKTNMKLVVEGVETQEQLDIMLKNGVDYIQGYFFGRPMSPEQLASRLDRFTVSHSQAYTDNEVLYLTQTGRESYLITTSTFNLQSRCMQILLTEPDLEAAFRQVLELVGTHTKVSRAYIYQHNPGGGYSHCFSWRDKSLPNGEMHPVDPGNLFSQWLQRLGRDDSLVANNLTSVPGWMRDSFRAAGMSAVLLVPLLNGDKNIGFVGLDNAGARHWQPEEVIMLRNLALIISGGLKKMRQRREADSDEVLAASVLKEVPLPMFISDLDTCDILWHNEAMLDFWGEGAELCYGCTHAFGDAARCKDCQLKLLLNNPSVGQVSREYHNEHTGRTYLIHNALVPWQKGFRAQLEYSVDITDICKGQRQMEYLASTNAITGAPDTASLLVALPKQLEQAALANQPLTLCYVQVVASQADVAAAFRNTSLRLLPEASLLVQAGALDFVLTLTCNTSQAVTLLTQLRMEMQKELSVEAPFRFGVAEAAELPFRKGNRYIRSLLDLAERRMAAFTDADVSPLTHSALRLFEGN